MLSFSSFITKDKQYLKILWNIIMEFLNKNILLIAAFLSHSFFINIHNIQKWFVYDFLVNIYCYFNMLIISSFNCICYIQNLWLNFVNIISDSFSINSRLCLWIQTFNKSGVDIYGMAKQQATDSCQSYALILKSDLKKIKFLMNLNCLSIFSRHTLFCFSKKNKGCII